MPRIRHLSSAVAVALAFSGAAQAQSFSNYVVFGDSLSDAGNVAAFSTLNGVPLPVGNSFTTNFDPVYAQLVGAAYGFDITNYSPFLPGTAGTDYAVGGACAEAESATFHCDIDPSGTGLFSVAGQIDSYLTANGGHADPNALYSVWSGANDIFTASAHPFTAVANTRIAADVTIGLISELQDSGANLIIVFNLPDLGLTPSNVGTGSQSGASTLTTFYNLEFNEGLATLGDGIVPINVYGLVNDAISNPGLYGFTDVTHMACHPADSEDTSDPSSVACGPTGSGLPYVYDPGTNDTFLFADGVHPTGAGHRLLAQAIVAELSAPGQIAMMGEAGLKAYEDHSRVINSQIFEGRGAERADDSTLGFANLQYSNIGYDATANTGQTDINQTALTVGADYRGSESYNLGGAVTLSSQQITAGGARIDGRAVMFSVYGVLNAGRAYFDAVASGGSDNFDVHRHIQLGAADRVEEGNTSGSQNAFELGAGYLFGDGIKHGPFVDVTWQKIDVNNFAETGTASTQMTFSSFTRDSLISRLGYELHGTASSWRPYARLAYNKESRNDPSFVTAGLVAMNGHFTLPGLVPTDNWWTADLGLGFDINDTTTASVSYSGLFGDDLQDRNTINFGVTLKF